jgi:hypothetical protein
MRSGFVTVVAWTFIALAAFGMLLSMLQYVLFSFLLPLDQLQAAMRHMYEGQRLPWIYELMFENFRLFIAIFFVLSAAVLAVAVGVLHRRNWARIALIGFLAVGILWNVAGLAMLIYVPLPAFAPTLENVPPEIAEQMAVMQNVMQKVAVAANAVFIVVFAVLFGWIIKRLASAPIRQEFS